MLKSGLFRFEHFFSVPSRSEFNRADVSGLKITDCPGNNMETEDSVGFDDELSDDDLKELFDCDDLEVLDEE